MTFHHLPKPPEPITRITTERPFSRIANLALSPAFDDRFEHHPIYALQHIDTNGCQTTRVLSLTEYLWHVIQQHCHQSCHTIHIKQRGDYRCAIESGNHDGKRWHYRAATWDQLIHKITLDLLPGYWTPPWPQLTYLGSDPLGHQLSGLLPGESLAIDTRILPNSELAEFITQSTPLDRILEGITSSAYHLVVRPPQPDDLDHFTRRGKTIVQRLQHSLEDSSTRAYVSPDRRHHYTQDPRTGLYHLKA